MKVVALLTLLMAGIAWADDAGPRLADQTIDANDKVRSDARFALQHLPPADQRAALARLQRHLASADPEIRGRAITALPWIRVQGDDYVRLVTISAAVTKDRDPAVRIAALQALQEKADYAGKEVREAKAIPPLIVALRDTNEKVRCTALTALGIVIWSARIGGQPVEDRRVVPAVIARLGDPSAMVRLCAIETAGQLADDRAGPSLRPFLRDRAPEVRQAAAISLGKITDAGSLSFLIPLLSDKEAAVRSAAHDALVKITGSEEPGDDPDAWQALASRGDLAGIALRRKLDNFHQAKQNREGIRYALQHWPLVQQDTFASFLVGEMALESRDFAAAEKGYAAAIQSYRPPLTAHGRPITNPFVAQPPTHFEWACWDGLGSSLLGAKKFERAIVALRTALTKATAEDHREGIARANYNLACCHARLNQFALAHAELKLALEQNEDYYTLAANDEDLRDALRRPEFKALLKP